jgi:uncharacterized membrane protein
MGKNEYLAALKRAMDGIDPESQARTLAYYEQRFIDGLAAGRSEEEIAADLDEPKKIAMTLRASSHREAFAQKKSPANLVRMLVSLFGLLIFNLFMVVPAMVYFSLLATMYACAIAFYLGGVAITASGLAGANELVIDGPLKHFNSNHEEVWEAGEEMQTKVSISNEGIRVYQEKAPEADIEAARAARDAARDTAEAVRATKRAMKDSEKALADSIKASRDAARITSESMKAAAETIKNIAPDDEADDEVANRSERVLRGAEAVAGHGVRISTDLDAGSRTTQTIFGLAMVIGAILLFLLSLVVSKYTFIGIRRYIDMNISLLKGR